MEIEFGSEIKQKDVLFDHLNSDHNQTKQEVEYVKRIKNQYEVKMALLSQEVERLSLAKERQANEIQGLKGQLRENEGRYMQSMRDSSYNNQTVDTLSQEIQRLNIFP